MSDETIGQLDQLAVQFPRSGDRFAHVITMRGAGCAESLEGDADNAWPASPPLQQLSVEELGGGPVGLLVGMAGHSHWSLAVEAHGDELVFDAACRVRGEDGKLGSSYRLPQETSVENTAEDASHIVTTCNEGKLHWSADNDADFAACRLQWDESERSLSIHVVDPINAGDTIRWRYRVRPC